MGVDAYGDERLVELYDLDNPDGEDHAYYRALAVGTRKVLDFGCGTGLLTRSLVAPGRVVVGVDPSPTMLGYARRRPGADAVRWIDGDYRAIEPSGDLDLVVSSGNTMMHVSDADHVPALSALAGALRSGGTIAFETRNPAARAWEQWTREATYGERDTPIGRLREWIDLIEVADGRVTFDAHNVFPDGRDAVCRNVLHFRTPTEITIALHHAGFPTVTINAGWHSEPLTNESRLLVVRAWK
ncbi:class I SAM-dependent methyltransferase [Kribbella solani]|uniref:class I SAM-dependent methyltransferase n=1 Tax=Kribbella solani TaxID=236067 RepID=UPI0029A629DB|nr:class I SAM-dependent methyltransferase [Kribbella solani]MDX2974426.1 class I SAM-dependent methyltransferase [Kribbella solani]